MYRTRPSAVLLGVALCAAMGSGFALARATQTGGAPGAASSKVAALQWKSSSWGGSEAIMHRSADGRRVFGSFKEKGTFKNVRYDFDEYGYVLAGRGSAKVHGGPEIVFEKGDMFFFKKGTVVDSTLSDDFQDVAVIVSDKSVDFSSDAMSKK